jgi:hypothetical protein
VADLTTQRAVECRDPGPAPGLPERSERQPADPPPVLPGGVPLPRLVSLARLTAPQALEIGAGVLAEAAQRAEADTGSPGGDQVLIEQVLVGVDGRVLLVPAEDGSHNGRPPAVGPAGPAVAAVLAAVAGAARLGARRNDPVAERLLDELDRAVTDLPVAGVPAVARTLREAAAAIDRGAVCAELAALVRAIGRSAGSASGTAPAGDRPAALRAAPERRAGHGQGRTARRRRIGAWLLSVLVLAAVVLAEVATLRGHIATDIRLLLDAGRSGSAASTAPPPDGLPIAAPAPAAAGSVTAVDLRPLAPCVPRAACSLRLLVRLVPEAAPQIVTWSYRIVDLCTGATGTARGGAVAVPARADRAEAVDTVPLPALRAVAVVAVTDRPASAASPPVLAGSCLSRR